MVIATKVALSAFVGWVCGWVMAYWHHKRAECPKCPLAKEAQKK